MTEFKQVSRALTERIIGCAIAVHEQLGPGFLEAVYQQCLALEMKARGLQFQNNRKIPLVYRGVRISASYRFDFVVETSVLLEVKSVENLAPIHRAQAINHLKLTGLSVGLVINFNVAVLAQGVRRLVHPVLRQGERPFHSLKNMLPFSPSPVFPDAASHPVAAAFR
jgi:GxxExxY protein